MNRGRPGIKHEERSELLSAIAILSGYDLNYNKCLPDGTRPDVLRIDSKCGSIFLGEAKDTESPTCTETLKRLSRYMQWFRLVTEKHKGSTFVVCFGDESQATGWKSTLSALAKSVGIGNFRIGCGTMEDGTLLIWLNLG